MRRGYFFQNLQKAEVVKTNSLAEKHKLPPGLMALGDPYTVVLSSGNGRQLFIRDTWMEPNTNNFRPKMGEIVYEDELEFKTEAEAKRFQSAALSYAKSCGLN